MCLSFDEIIKNDGAVVSNSDGTISVFYNNPELGQYPVQLTLECCKAIDPTYIFDIDTQKCKWSDTPISCGFSKPINLVINSNKDNGTLFFVNDVETEKCGLEISFDYLLKIKCENLMNIANPTITTNYLVNETLSKINVSQQQIEDLNSQIEIKNNVIISLNDEIAITPYSIECDKFPITTDKCYKYEVSALSPGYVTWYDCNGKYNTKYLNYSESYTITCAKENSVHGNIKSSKGNICNEIQTKLPNFDNSGFESKTIDNTLADVNLTKTDLAIYSSVNYCLTEAGLNIWKNILTTLNYDLFINGDSNSYTCDDVINIAKESTDTNLLIYSCDTPFGKKSNLIETLNKEVLELTNLKKELSDEQNNLISLENSVKTTTNSNSGCTTVIKALESIDIEMYLDYIDDDKTNKIAFSAVTFPAINLTSNLYEYLAESGNSGFYLCGNQLGSEITLSACTSLSLNNGVEKTPNVSSCDELLNEIFKDLPKESFNKLSNDALASNWLTYKTIIDDPEIIKLITNKKIKINFRVNFSCVDFCILLDNIVLDKYTLITSKDDILITKNPGFEIKKIVDNKKSWSDANTQTNRSFIVAKSNGNNPFRQTNYDLNDERLIINSKEIDLDISVASAIETDVWCYLNDNYDVLNSITYCSPCNESIKNFQSGEDFNFMNDFFYNFQDSSTSNIYVICCGDTSVDFNALLTTKISTINNINDFDNIMFSELIDAKNRQTISGYPTLRAVYERYINSIEYTNTVSSAFNYITMDNFSKLIGNYWVDIIEQVVPSTSIWGSVKIHTNTIFDEQKFKYKEYTTLYCTKNIDCDIIFSGLNETNHILSVNSKDVPIEIVTSVITSDVSYLKVNTKTTIYDNIFLSQMNVGSEFLGKVLTVKK